MVPHRQVFLSRLVSLVRPSLSLPPSVFVANGSKSWQLWQDQGQLVLALDSLLFPSTLFPSIRPLRVHLCICLKANLTIEKKGVSLVFFPIIGLSDKITIFLLSIFFLCLLSFYVYFPILSCSNKAEYLLRILNHILDIH